MANAVMINGRMKWSAKNRVSVGFLTLNPPHNQFTRGFPI